MTSRRRRLSGVAGAAVLVVGLAGLGAAAVGTTGPPGSQARQAPWQWPLAPPHQVVHPFAPPAHDWLPGHRGVDLAGHVGERVATAGAGTVTFAGSIAGIGVVTVETGDLRTTYQPLDVRVHADEQVVAGQTLGRLTLTGSHCAPAACLHWGLLRGSTYLDPMALLGLAVVRLLPLDGH